MSSLRRKELAKKLGSVLMMQMHNNDLIMKITSVSSNIVISNRRAYIKVEEGLDVITKLSEMGFNPGKDYIIT